MNERLCSLMPRIISQKKPDVKYRKKFLKNARKNIFPARKPKPLFCGYNIG